MKEISKEYIENVYNLKKLDILKVGRHSSKYSSSKKFLDKVKPIISLISSFIKNRFNHLNVETIKNRK